jgi:hypothetical protein
MKKQYSIFCTWVLLGGISILPACGNQPVKSVTIKPSAAIESSAETFVARPDPVAAARSTLEQKFLEQAERAFARGRLTSPPHDNAYDKFHSVLMINPNNQTARSGLQAILIRYAEMIRKAHATSQYTRARVLMAQADVYYPGHRLLLQLKKDIQQTRKVYEQPGVRPIADIKSLQEFELPADTLRENKEALLPLLGSIAQRIKVTDESIMIYARTDAEGRWIYSQLREAVPGYRVRGDIRLAKRPKVAILPPL